MTDYVLSIAEYYKVLNGPKRGFRSLLVICLTWAHQAFLWRAHVIACKTDNKVIAIL